MSWACRTVTKFAALWEANSAEIDVQGCFLRKAGRGLSGCGPL